MNDHTASSRSSARDWGALLAFLLLCLAISALGGTVTARSVSTWYPLLQKPPFNPPAWVFAPVWTLLYLMIAVAGWRLWRRRAREGARPALAAWALQLALNLGWSFVFFGAHMIGAAFAEILILLAAIGATLVLSWRVDRLASMLLVPYVGWVAFASVLNYSLWRLN